MSTIFYEAAFDPFDILVKNFFQESGNFSPISDAKVSHPVDIYLTESHLIFDIACTGIRKEEIEILTQSNILRVNYDKKTYAENEHHHQYLHRGIAKRSFNLGWKIDSKFDISKSEASFSDGLLTVAIPYSDGMELKRLDIQ